MKGMRRAKSKESRKSLVQHTVTGSYKQAFRDMVTSAVITQDNITSLRISF